MHMDLMMIRTTVGPQLLAKALLFKRVCTFITLRKQSEEECEDTCITLTDKRGGCFTGMNPRCNVDHLLLLSLRAVQVVWVRDG